MINIDLDKYLENLVGSGMYSIDTEDFPYYQWDKPLDDWNKKTEGTKGFKTSLYYNNGVISFEIFPKERDICLSWDCDDYVINWVNQSLKIVIPLENKIDWAMQGVTCKGEIKCKQVLKF